MEWMYRFLKYEEGELRWNSTYYNNILGSDSLSSFVFLYLDTIIPEEIYEDIRKQHISIDTPISHKSISGSIFLSSALSWWQNR